MTKSASVFNSIQSKEIKGRAVRGSPEKQKLLLKLEWNQTVCRTTKTDE